MKTNAPFCLLAIGVQGSGKSHTLSIVMENSVFHCPPVTNAQPSSSVLVFHYDSDEQNHSEAITLTRPNDIGCELNATMGNRQMVILVSPSYFVQRQRFYSKWQHIQVKPLLFRWEDLTATHIKQMMRVSEEAGEMPLYMSVLLDLLRRIQRQDRT